jgi:aspartyl-tRNA(Asn)/glutamyl-tRNA(Gln) amidotransferase subunit A
MTALLNLDLCEAARKVRTGEVSSESLTQQAIARARHVQPLVNCFISLDEEQALTQARAADLAIARGDQLGALHGVPLAHKDMIYRAGHITTGGSSLLAQQRASVTATVARRLDEAGAIWLGGLHMAEFAANPIGQNASYGDCHNAWAKNRISGGSSSGSAVAVALRACYGSLGSDTGGSIRLPAALNGIVGLRPTYGRVSRYGVLPRTWSMDTIGPMARTAKDCARLLGVIAGADSADSSSSALPVPDYEAALTGDIRDIRIAIPTDYFYDDLSPEVNDGLERSLHLLTELGAQVIRVPVSNVDLLYQLGNLISQVEAAAIHGKLVKQHGDAYPMVLKTRMESGSYVPAIDYLGALSARARLVQAFTTEVFSKADVLHVPVIGMAAPLFKDITPTSSSDVFPLLARTARYTRPFSTLGVPAVAVPAGFTTEGLPIGFQLVGRPFSEALLLRVADAYQQASDWHRCVPAI